MTKSTIFITQPVLPPLDELMPYLEQIWQRKIVTNMGPLHQELEGALCDYLKVTHLNLFNNGTNALLTALQACELSGEVITTPFTFVATTNSIVWNKLTPVFVDIDPKSLNLDPNKIEAAITDKTSAILPVHCYGNPCEVDAIQKIADRYHLKVIYDAAHAFGVEDMKGSILRHGDASILSFHATKVFNTIEGGAIICHNAKMKKKIDVLKNFGIEDEINISEIGINGKMNEIQAAIGLLQLQVIDELIEQRKQIAARYQEAIQQIDGLELVGIQRSEGSQSPVDCWKTPMNYLKRANHGYFPILIKDNYPLTRDQLYNKLKEAGIYPRRYFYPLISNLPSYSHLASAQKTNLPVANDIAERILCLPIYPALQVSEQNNIINELKER